MRQSFLRHLAERRALIRLRPDDAELLDDTAWILATNPNPSFRNGAEAVELARHAVKLTAAQDPRLLDTLAAAYAEAGRFAEAVQAAQQAIDLATRQNKPAVAAAIKARCEVYETKTAFREPPGRGVANSGWTSAACIVGDTRRVSPSNVASRPVPGTGSFFGRWHVPERSEGRGDGRTTPFVPQGVPPRFNASEKFTRSPCAGYFVLPRGDSSFVSATKTVCAVRLWPGGPRCVPSRQNSAARADSLAAAS